MYSDFVLVDRFLFLSYRAKTHTHRNTHTHRDSNEYPIVAFSKNATIISYMAFYPIDVLSLSTSYNVHILLDASHRVCMFPCSVLVSNMFHFAFL